MAIDGREGQATVEAAVLLPTLMLVMALLLQPVCLSYTHVVMRSAAAETARAVATDYDEDLGDCREFALRRLGGVPDVPLFHVGARDGWEVSCERRGSDVTVSIMGHARPLPLLGVVMSAFSESDGEGVVLRESVRERVRPDWLEGSYATWQGVWG